MHSASIPYPSSPGDLREHLQQPWFQGIYRILRRRELLLQGAGLLLLLILGSSIVSGLYPPLHEWFHWSLAGVGVVFIALLLGWLYEHARVEELLEEWVDSMISTIGRSPNAEEVLSWVEQLDIAVPQRILEQVQRPVLKQVQLRLLLYAEELAIKAIEHDPLEWTHHAGLAQCLSQLDQLQGDTSCKLRALEELAILQALAPQNPHCWQLIADCAELLAESEVELHARERLSLLLPDRQATVDYGLALFRHGLTGQAFALYRQIVEEDPSAAQRLIAGYHIPRST